MKKIALIMDGWGRFFTYAWPAGILQKIRERNADANLYIFNSSGSWSLDADYNTGEYNIYRLPDFRDFDGIILDLNNIGYKSVRDFVVERAKASGKPVLSIANEIEDFYYVGIDNYRSIREIINHLAVVHGCRKFWFVMADMENYESMVRTKSLRDYMEEKKLPCEEHDFYFEDFTYECGYHAFSKLKETHTDMPDAVVCANDNIAVGFCEAAKKAGYQAPKDFLVTGFDDFDKATCYIPYLSTVSHVREEVGYCCADILLKIWAGEPVEKFNYTETKSIFSESCGCANQREIDHRGHARDQIIYGIETDEFQAQVLVLEYELLHCKTVQEMILCIQRCFPFMKCDAIYLVLDDHINDFRNQKEFSEHMLSDEEEFHIEGYPDHMNVELAYEDGEVLDCAGKQIDALFPMFDFEQNATDFLFIPLHFRNLAVGYFVIRNAVYLMEKQYLYHIMNALTTAIENLHKKEKAQYLNKMLSDLYVKDAMTGLYNRMGLKEIAVRQFNENKRKRENMLIMFIDMDRLKYINDHFGHESGDLAIRTIAGTILHYCPQEAVPIRTGGDEFLVILPALTQRESEELKTHIRGEIADAAERMELPFALSVSIGCVYTDMGSDRTLDDYIREADEIMYREKREKKAERGR